MVRKDEMKDTSIFTKLISQVIRNKVQEKGIKQTQLGQLIGRSQSYVGTRINGQQSWTLDDLDNIAVALGYENAFTIFDLARGLDPTQNKQTITEQKPQVREEYHDPKEVTDEEVQDTIQRFLNGMGVAAYQDESKNWGDPDSQIIPDEYYDEPQ